MSLEDIHEVFGKINVLHIDDDALQLNILKENMSFVDKEIVIDSEINIEKALSKIQNNEYDCILMDLIMPYIDGIELSQRIRTFTDIPIILYTLKESKNLTKNSFISGINDFLTKDEGINHFKILDEKIRSLTKEYRTKHIYNVMIKSNKNSVVVLDENLKIKYNNYVFLKLVKDNNVADKNILEYIDKYSEKHVKNFLKKKSKENLIKATIINSDGKLIFTEIEKNYISKKGESFVLLKIKDLTGLLEEDIRSSAGKDRFHTLANLTPDAIMLANIYGYITYVNPAYTRLTGYTYEEVVGRHFLKLQVFRDRNLRQYWKLVSQVLSGKNNNMTTEFGYTRKDGKVGIGDVFFCLHKIEGKPEIIGVVRDRTESKKKEEEFQNIFDTSSEGLLYLDLEGKIIKVNDSALNILDITRGDLEGKNILELQDKSLNQEINVKEIYSNIIDNKEVNSFDIKLNEKFIEVNITLVEVLDEKLGIQINVRDITLEKLEKIEKEKYTSELENIVQKRTNQILDNEKMVTLAKISSMITHDLKGPLQVIGNALYLMKIKPESTEKYISYINDALNQANSLLMEMNESSKSGELRIESVNFSELIDESLLQAKVTEEIILETYVPSSIIVNIDRSKMKRVLYNLIKNSIEAMPEGGKIKISAVQKGEILSLSISDTGIGISEERINTIFRPFQSSKSTGMGIGLNFVKNTIDAHGGEISIKSKVGKGTTFTIKLPLNNKIRNPLDEIKNI